MVGRPGRTEAQTVPNQNKMWTKQHDREKTTLPKSIAGPTKEAHGTHEPPAQGPPAPGRAGVSDPDDQCRGFLPRDRT